MNTMILLVFAACMPTTYYPEGGSSSAYATVERVEVYKSKEELFKKTGANMYFQAQVLVIKDGIITEQISHYDFGQKMETERLAKTKPAMPKMFSCLSKWKCTGNENKSVCLCNVEGIDLKVEIDHNEECTDTECRKPVKNIDNTIIGTSLFPSTMSYTGHK